MTLTTLHPSRTVRRAGLAAGLLALVFPLSACGEDEPATPEPTNISLAPSSPPAQTSQTPGASATTQSVSPSASDPSTAQSEGNLKAAGAVAAAESAVADSFVVEVSKDDDHGTVEWEVTVRVGDNGRELRISDDGTVLRNQADSLSSAQRGSVPEVSAREAIQIAEKQVADGEVTDAELSRENGQRVWDISVDVPGGDEWELWLDDSSGKVLRKARD